MKSIDDKILLNSGRNCLRYIVKTYQIREINIPYYICPVIWQVLKEENVKIKFYHIDKNFMPVKTFGSEEYVLYPNYFGICGNQSYRLSLIYKNLILDNAHALFAPKKGIAAFYSPRKFFKVNDGGILDCSCDSAENFVRDDDRLEKILTYDEFCKNELSLYNNPIKRMSFKTEQFLKNIDFNQIKREKRLIFDKIHQKLRRINDFDFSVTKSDVPMVYPIKSKNMAEIAKILTKCNIYLLKYWTSLPNEFQESFFQNEILYIPITQKSLKVIENFKFFAEQRTLRKQSEQL
ncbi:MAG: hypothetical protein ACI37T_00540 [Candidatus Gastranaerophilaceae bacterium]